MAVLMSGGITNSLCDRFMCHEQGYAVPKGPLSTIPFATRLCEEHILKESVTVERYRYWKMGIG